jgi:cell division protein FtsB
MTGPRSRRAGTTAVRRSTGRPLSRAASRPVPAGRDTPGRPAQRPAAQRPTGRGAARPAARVARRPLVSGRVVLVVGLVLLLALTLAGPVRGWLAGRQTLAQLAAQRSALDERVHELQQQLTQQADPAWAARQARERLRYVLPGDRLLVVVDGTRVEGAAGTLPAGGARPAPAPPWYDGLMQSIGSADRAGSGR